MKKALLALFILIIAEFSIVLAESEPELVEIKGKYLVVKIPPEYKKEVEKWLPLWDQIYVMLCNLTSYKGKIKIWYTSTSDDPSADLFNNRVMITKVALEGLHRLPESSIHFCSLDNCSRNRSYCYQCFFHFFRKTMERGLGRIL